jgi:tRNA (adenine57-N1/adenine58-N1)-methyltransferase
MRIARAGDLALVITQDLKTFTIRLEPGGQLQIHKGILDHDQVLGQPLGRELQTHLGSRCLVVEPTTYDLIQALKRRTQIMYPKDIGYVLLRLGIGPGSRVIEGGTGSGGLTLALARAVGPSGRVYTYEGRADNSELAQENLARLGLDANVTFYVRNLRDGFEETDADALFLDVRTPWRYLDAVEPALKDSGVLGAFLPTTPQVSHLVAGLEEQGIFANIEVEEIQIRPWKPVPGRLRPVDRMIAHTGFLIFARKVTREAVAADYWADRRRRKHEEKMTLQEEQEDAD